MILVKKINHIKIFACDDIHKIGIEIANQIITSINSKPNSVICLTANDIFRQTYECLIKNKKKTNFRFVKFFNSWEVTNINHNFKSSSSYFMANNLYKYIRFNKKNIYFPDVVINHGIYSMYDRFIWSIGGIDLSLIPILEDGTVLYNNSNDINKLTHVITINKKSNINISIITMGMRTILNSKRIISIIKGKNMLKILKKIIKGEYDENSIFTCLLLHKDVSIYIDNELYALLNE